MKLPIYLRLLLSGIGTFSLSFASAGLPQYANFDIYAHYPTLYAAVRDVAEIEFGQIVEHPDELYDDVVTREVTVNKTYKGDLSDMKYLSYRPSKLGSSIYQFEIKEGEIYLLHSTPPNKSNNGGLRGIIDKSESKFRYLEKPSHNPQIINFYLQEHSVNYGEFKINKNEFYIKTVFYSLITIIVLVIITNLRNKFLV